MTEETTHTHKWGEPSNTNKVEFSNGARTEHYFRCKVELRKRKGSPQYCHATLEVIVEYSKGQGEEVPTSPSQV
jgi:hypothetical protein